MPEEPIPTTEDNSSEVEFSKSDLLKLDTTNSRLHGINPARWERANDEINFQDLVQEFTGKYSNDKISCPFHGTDSTPSFGFWPHKNNGFCFGCLSESEYLWSVERGLVKIVDIQIGEIIWDRYGEKQRVLWKEEKEGELLAIETKNFRRDPLRLTPDHTCLFVPFSEARNKLPYIDKNHKEDRFIGPYKRALENTPRKTRKKPDTVRIIEAPARDLCPGDYLLYPVIKKRTSGSLDNSFSHKTQKYGLPSRRVPSFPVTPECCYLYGLYLAEGSKDEVKGDPKSVSWTFHIKEKDTLAAYVQKTLAKVFNLSSHLSLIPEHKTCVVVCCSVELARGLSFWFGRDCYTKQVPGVSLGWPVECQKALVDGYLSGDGCCDRPRASTSSRTLAYALFALGIQAGLLPSVGYYPAFRDKHGEPGAEYWSVDFCEREGINRFFQKIQEETYYWSRISKVIFPGISGRVVDIIVEGSQSFLTKLAAIHNCPPSEQFYDNIRFVSKWFSISRTKALIWLEKYGKLPPMDDVILEDEDEEEVSIEFADLSEAYIRQAAREVQKHQDVEMAQAFVRIYFEAEFDKDALALARVLDPSTLEYIRQRKVFR